MSAPEKLLPVTLPSWPTCDNCLSWSEDDLAVAGGEFAHILTQKSSVTHSETAGHPQWHVLTLRVNVFQQDEWPEQTLATIADLSIGEEQTNCYVVALSWSNAGLGVHRRSVLGILTSNLVLSLWETNGSQIKYQRTCVVNQYLADHDTSGEGNHDRRALRIRSFVWLDPFKVTSASKWGLHFLLIADDNNSITLWQISKASSVSLGNWELKRVLEVDIPDIVSTDKDLENMSPLQRRLYEQNPITKLDISHSKQTILHSNIADDREDISTYQLTLRVERGITEHTVVMYATVSESGRQVSFSLAKHLQVLPPSLPDPEQNVSPGRPTTGDSINRTVVKSMRSRRYFQDALQPLCDNFDRSNQLCGHFRVRMWGTATSVNGTTAAACVTLHPLDMIEYTIPSTEKSTLVFRSTGKVDSKPPPSSRSKSSVYERILEFLRDNLRTNSAIISTFDKKLIRTYVSFANTVLGPASSLAISLCELQKSLQVDNTHTSIGQMLQTNKHHQASDQSYDQPEDCEICGAPITFTSDTMYGSCHAGHQFSRCQLCFVAIQEPGISKYCSQCGKQFLDPVKLGLGSGPSFTQMIFDEFDLCPYCQAKFRG